jgi:hypothetical protein
METVGTQETGDPDLPEAIDAAQLTDKELMRELESLHRTRHDTFLHGSPQALVHHTERMTELEGEYLRRFPDRRVNPGRLRPED